MESTISKMIESEQEQIPDVKINETLKQLDSYLNSDYENEYEEYVEPLGAQIPTPILTPAGLWKIPGTTKEFETPMAATNAAKRYNEFYKRNQASILIYGVPFDEYMTGVDNTIVPTEKENDNSSINSETETREI